MKGLGLSAEDNRYLIISILSTTSFITYTAITLFYVPFQTAFGLTNTQISTLVNIYTVASFLFYYLAGTLCDRISPKICMCVACLGSGITGLLIAEDPGYEVMKILFAVFPVGIISWASLCKVMRQICPDPDKIGKVFGVESLVEGSVASAALLAGVLVYGDDMGRTECFTAIIRAFSLFTLACGILLIFGLDYKKIAARYPQSTQQKGVSPLRILKLPEMWAVGFICSVYFGINTIVNYASPYLINVFGFPLAWTTMFSILTRNVMKSFAGYAGGALRDRMGASWKSIRLLSVFAILGFAALAALPLKQELLVPACIITAFVIFIFNANASAASITLAEMDPPASIYGTMTGFNSLIGSVGTLAVSTVAGPVLDKMGNEGYRYIFLMGIGIELIFLFIKQIRDLADRMPGSLRYTRNEFE